jgi:tripartite-type tricarboxylate transporter receptor subunit TctC
MGFANFEYYAWHGISTTAGTPKPIIKRLNIELRTIFSDPAFKAKWLEIGSESVAGTPRGVCRVHSIGGAKNGAADQDAGH